jgi:hypothetical protein
LRRRWLGFNELPPVRGEPIGRVPVSGEWRRPLGASQGVHDPCE